ncbi:MAG: TIM-barrel domain-containing protein, partial [Turicibacter sp.]
MIDVVAGYTSLTGTTPLPQKWTLGYQQSRFSYATEERVEELVAKFRELDVPCDVIHLDIHHMDAFKVFTFHPEKYPNPKALIDKALASGIKLVPIVDPGVKKEAGYDVFDEGLTHSYFAKDSDGIPYVNRVWPGDALYPDFTNPDARAWWGENHRKLTELGIKGIWTDMNEPSSFNGPLPDDVQFKEGNHAKIHNVYGHFMSQATYEGMKKITNKRPFVITRAAYSGTQKYSTIWTGDNQSFWDHLRMAIPQQLNLGLSGFSIVGTDIGGFSFDTTKELLCRWIQVGCFSPLCRNHASDHTRDQEPWAFDEETLAINRKFIKLRYKLLPYFYDLLWQGEQTGLPVMRPLVLHYQHDENVKEMNDQFMVGESVLVAPVVTQGSQFRAVYLPQGDWYDYETFEMYEGCRVIVKHAPLDTCPIFIKAGSIIPNYPQQNFVGEIEIDELSLDIYPGTGMYDHIQDDGESFSYRAGQYNHYGFTQSEGTVEINRVKLNDEKKYVSF